MKRKRISLAMCVYSTGDTPTVSKKEQEELEHLHRLKKIDEISRREKSEVHTTVVVKKKWNPAIHRYAWLDKFKVRINSQEEFDRFYGYVKITKNLKIMKEIYGLKHFDGTMDLMDNFDKVKLSDDIFIGRYWYAFIYDDSFLRDYNISKENILNSKPTLNNGWFRLAIYSEFYAAPHFVFKTPNNEILCLMCLTSK